MIVAIIIVGLLSVIILGFLYAIAPGEKRDVSEFKGLMFAHRGLHEPGVPENSKLAFKRAREAGYGVELDVQYTKDKKLVVFHDATLKRMCGVDGRVDDFTYEELQEFSLDNSEEKIPLFSEVLELLGQTHLVCEIKNNNGNINDDLCQDTYDMLKEYKGKYCIESFSPFLVKWFRINHPEVIRGQLSANLKKDSAVSRLTGFMMSELLINFISRPDFIAYRHKDTGVFGYRICSKFYKPLLIAWTARGNEEQASAWRKFDSVIFELYENENPVE